ncbi:hypothetical protein ACWGII_26020 [Streptomyces sp. NPDC054855]
MDAAPRGLWIVLDGGEPTLLGGMLLLTVGLLAFGFFLRLAGVALGGHRRHGGSQLGNGAVGCARESCRVG